MKGRFAIHIYHHVMDDSVKHFTLLLNAIFDKLPLSLRREKGAKFDVNEMNFCMSVLTRAIRKRIKKYSQEIQYFILKAKCFCGERLGRLNVSSNLFLAQFLEYHHFLLIEAITDKEL